MANSALARREFRWWVILCVLSALFVLTSPIQGRILPGATACLSTKAGDICFPTVRPAVAVRAILDDPLTLCSSSTSPAALASLGRWLDELDSVNAGKVDRIGAEEGLRKKCQSWNAKKDPRSTPNLNGWREDVREFHSNLTHLHIGFLIPIVLVAAALLLGLIRPQAAALAAWSALVASVIGRLTLELGSSVLTIVLVGTPFAVLWLGPAARLVALSGVSGHRGSQRLLHFQRDTRAALDAAIERMRERGGVVALRGRHGVGKSSILDDLQLLPPAKAIVVRVDCWAAQTDPPDTAIFGHILFEWPVAHASLLSWSWHRYFVAWIFSILVPKSWSWGGVQLNVVAPTARWHQDIQHIAAGLGRDGRYLVVVLDEIDRCEPIAAQRFMTMATRLLTAPNVVCVVSYVDHVLRYKVFDPSAVELPELKSTMLAILADSSGVELTGFPDREAREKELIRRFSANSDEGQKTRLVELFEEKFFGGAPVEVGEPSSADIAEFANQVVRGRDWCKEFIGDTVQGEWQRLLDAPTSVGERDTDSVSLRRISGRLALCLAAVEQTYLPFGADGKRQNLVPHRARRSARVALRIALASIFYRRLPAWPEDLNRLPAATCSHVRQPEAAIVHAWWRSFSDLADTNPDEDFILAFSRMEFLRQATFAVPDGFERMSASERSRRVARPCSSAQVDPWLSALATHLDREAAERGAQPGAASTIVFDAAWGQVALPDSVRCGLVVSVLGVRPLREVEKEVLHLLQCCEDQGFGLAILQRADSVIYERLKSQLKGVPTGEPIITEMDAAELPAKIRSLKVKQTAVVNP